MSLEDRNIARLAALTGTLYFALAVLAIETSRLSGGIALIWTANGVLLSTLCYLKPRRWPWPIAACACASMIATLLLRHNLMGAVSFAGANVLEALLAAWLLRHWGTARRMLDDVRSVALFALAGGVLAPMASGVFGAAAGHVAYGLPFGSTWFDWSAGHGLGTLIAAPLAVLVMTSDFRNVWRTATLRDWLRVGGLMVLVVAASVAVFAQNSLPLLFLPALPMMIATFVLGRSGAAGALLIIAVVGGSFTVTGSGPMHLLHGGQAQRLQFFEFYLATLFLMALPAAAMLTQRETLFRRLKANEAALRLLAENATDVLLSLDRDGIIRFASPSVRRLGGFDPDALVGRNAGTMVEPAYRAAVFSAHQAALRAPGETQTVEYQARLAKGGSAWFESNISALIDESGAVSGSVNSIRDVTHRKSLENSLRAAAVTDPLTGLINRRGFVDRLGDAFGVVRGGGSAVLAVFDLDHFKRVNDNWGHPAGDAVLVAVAEVCARELRGGDVIARIGGEEFAVLFCDTRLAEASESCERLRRAIERQPVLAPGAAQLIRVTASFGLAVITPGSDAEMVIGAADRALYEAKQGGRNQLRAA